MTKKFTRYQIATALAALFHTIGLVGILYVDQRFFARATLFNLLLMFGLIVWTQKERNIPFLFFFIIAFITGIGVELIGIHTSAIFGTYQYSNTLGPGVGGVPLVIGLNWFLIIFCCGTSIHNLLMRLIRRVALEKGRKPGVLKALSVVLDGATLAVFFDWVMEPVAVKLNFWHWGEGGEVPGYNYFCWLLFSMALLAVFHVCKFNKENKFAVNLFLIQLMFFLLLRTLLP